MGKRAVIVGQVAKMSEDTGIHESHQDRTDEVAGMFESSAQRVSLGEIRRLSQADKLELYALYSVATKGPLTKSRPSPYLDPRGYAKWEAWSSKKHLTKLDAELAYIALVDKLCRESGVKASWSTDDTVEEQIGGNASLRGFTILDQTSRESTPERSHSRKGTQLDITHWASLNDCKSVKFCLERQRVDPNYRDGEGLTALMRAADRNATDVIQILIKSGTKLDATDNDGQTAMHYAAICDHLEATRILIAAGADPSIADHNGDTVKHVAGPVVLEALNTGTCGPAATDTEKSESALCADRRRFLRSRITAALGAVVACVIAVCIALAIRSV